MDEITKKIEEMAEKMEKASAEPSERLFSVIKSLGAEGLKKKLPTLTDEEKTVLKAALEEMTMKKAVSFDKEAQSAKHIRGKITDTLIQEEIASDDADEKLMKPEAAKQDHQGTPTDGWEGQVIKAMEDNLDAVIEKAMEKCNDDKMVMKKLKEKGMDESKVQGALDKYKAKKDVKKSEPEAAPAEDLEKGKMKNKAMDKEEAKDKIMAMEEKEHGTKDPKKLVEAEKKEDKDEKKEDKKMKKSTTWEDDNRLFKSNVLGRNHSFNLEQFVNETVASEPKAEEIKKSETKKEDLNDIIAKSQDRNWDEIQGDVLKAEAKKKQNGTLTKSFEIADLAASMGLSEEEAKKILGE
jgi:hypothetical protein